MNLVKKVRNLVRHLLIGHLTYEHLHLEEKLLENKLMIGTLHARILKNEHFKNIQDAEFKVFSQFGEDGIIQYLINNLSLKNKTFVEIGSGDYSESNTRFLLEHNSWKGVIIDKEKDVLDFVQKGKGKYLYYSHDLTALCKEITVENVTSVLSKYFSTNTIGLLSLDIDGIDYWILEKVLSSFKPEIIVHEYNATFGNTTSVSVPLKSNFDRNKEHYSGLYFGASLPAFFSLITKNGYYFVGTNTAGNNAFFVKNSVKGRIPNVTLEKGFTMSTYRESKDKFGNLTYLTTQKERLNQIKSMKLIHVGTNKTIHCSDLIPK